MYLSLRCVVGWVQLLPSVVHRSAVAAVGQAGRMSRHSAAAGRKLSTDIRSSLRMTLSAEVKEGGEPCRHVA